MVTVNVPVFLLAVVVLAFGVCLFLVTPLSTGLRWPGYLVAMALTVLAAWVGYAAIA